MIEHLRRMWAAGKEEGERPKNFVADWTATLIVLVFGTTTMLQAYIVPTSSMESNILVGDHLLVDKMAYADPGSLGRLFLPYREVKRGDIIVFLYPEDIRTPYVKRVVGVPGDRIRLTDRTVVRNGKCLVEPYVQHIMKPHIDQFRDSFPQGESFSLLPKGRLMLEQNVKNGEVVVPAGQYFAMGDNRDNSLDSRYWGFVPRENIIGKPLVVYWSFAVDGTYPTDWKLEHLFNVAKNFFGNTRWSRTFMVPRAQQAGEKECS
jgi:signal peptidase I